nr:hypothetical protein [Tanacetum cinerariifolium]
MQELNHHSLKSNRTKKIAAPWLWVCAGEGGRDDGESWVSWRGAGNRGRWASKPLLLIKDRGHQIVHADYFINNDLKYLKSESSSSKYATSITRTNAVKYDNIEGIEDMVLTLWNPVKVAYNKHVVWGTVKVMRWYDYVYLEEILVRREDNVLYKFKECDFPRLNLRDIKDMLILLVRKKLSNLDVDDRVLTDISSNLEMDYLPKRHWSNLEMKRPRIMFKAIDKLFFEKRLMRNFEELLVDVTTRMISCCLNGQYDHVISCPSIF